MSRIVVIGGVAAGMSAASRARRRQPEAERVVLERGPRVFHAVYGMHCNIADALAGKRWNAAKRKEAAAAGRAAS